MVEAYYFLAIFGITFVITEDERWESFRDLVLNFLPYPVVNQVINCQLCLGFWMTLLTGWFLFGLYTPLVAFANYTIILIIRRIIGEDGREV